jgi:pimeloyl-ACP methyl ester carboxylesterase
MPYAAVDGLRMYYQEHGVPDGPPLVLLHNYTGTGATTWVAQIPAFGARYRLVVPDLRGHGRTVNPAGAAEMNQRRFARDVAALCRAVGLERALFCGASTGAKLLLTLALDEPDLVRALVLCGSTYYWSDDVRARVRAQTQTPETFLARLSPEAQASFRARHAAQGPEHWRTVVMSWFALAGHAHADDFPEQEALRRITAPTLLVHGDRDQFFPVEVPLAMYRLLPDAELCVLPDAHHLPNMERCSEWFNTIVLDFLARRAA